MFFILPEAWIKSAWVRENLVGYRTRSASGRSGEDVAIFLTPYIDPVRKQRICTLWRI